MKINLSRALSFGLNLSDTVC